MLLLVILLVCMYGCSPCESNAIGASVISEKTDWSNCYRLVENTGGIGDYIWEKTHPHVQARPRLIVDGTTMYAMQLLYDGMGEWESHSAISIEIVSMALLNCYDGSVSYRMIDDFAHCYLLAFYGASDSAADAFHTYFTITHTYKGLVLNEAQMYWLARFVWRERAPKDTTLQAGYEYILMAMRACSVKHKDPSAPNSHADVVDL